MRVQSHNFNNEVNYPKDQDKNLINEVNSILFPYLILKRLKYVYNYL